MTSFVYSPQASQKVLDHLRQSDFLTAEQIGSLESRSKQGGRPGLSLFLEDRPDLHEKTAQLIAHLSEHPFLEASGIQSLEPLGIEGFCLANTPEGKILAALDPWHERALAMSKKHRAPLRVISPQALASAGAAKSQLRLMEEEADAADANAFVYRMLKRCIHEGASDIHLDLALDGQGQAGFKLRYRLDGDCCDEGFYSDLMLYRGIVNKLKLDAGLKIDERRMPQDGRISFELDGKVHNFRLSFMPNTVRNQQEEKIVLRQMADVERCDLYQLEILDYPLRLLEQAIAYPHGFVCVTGPTGSGKTTLLYALLQQIDRIKTNVITLEDPIEAEIPLVNQSQIFHRIGYDFAAGLRVILRQDPDVIMVGEMRDEETALKAFEAANTGHLVFSTLHTNTAASSITRLLQMGVPHYFISSALKMVIAQRLVRRLCPSCRRPHPDAEAVSRSIQQAFSFASKAVKALHDQAAQGQALYAASDNADCEACRGAGYKGRMAIMEVMPIDDAIRHSISFEQGNEGKIQESALKAGMLTLQQYGYLQAMKGLTSFEEVNGVAADA